jgi:hypothetical protein
MLVFSLTLYRAKAMLSFADKMNKPILMTSHGNTMSFETKDVVKTRKKKLEKKEEF